MSNLLKFITCGSVDDGKSTLIGHMLYDAKLLFTDQEQALELDSRLGSRDGELDYSLLLDGLMAEREQGITIDVAYRYFTTEKRSFIVADTPGHEEYTRNMAVGASFAQLAVILIDASKGLLAQTRRHTRICSLMGIRHFLFALNKMDIVKYDGQIYQQMKKQVRQMLAEFEYDSFVMIPVSATEGDNITMHSDRMQWYQGPSLLEYLEEIETDEKEDKKGFLLPVQRVSRPNAAFRGMQGTIARGCIGKGDEVTVLPSGEKAEIRALLVSGKECGAGRKGQAVSIQLNREVDVSRGCILVKDYMPPMSRMFNVSLLWMDDDKMSPGRSYYIKLATKTTTATIINIQYRIDINTGERVHAESLYKNEIANCDIALPEKIAVDAFSEEKELGSFILIDRVSNMTSACGVIEHTMRRSDNLTWADTDVTPQMRQAKMGQKPLTLWFTGLSGAGKSTLASKLEQRLYESGKYTMLLDGDNVRMGLNNNLGFSEEDRIENIRRIAEVSKLMNEAGLIVLTAFISPYEKDRRNAREIIGENFVEIYVSTPLEECARRDVKGLYQKARGGLLPGFTGVTAPYEIPECPDITIDTTNMDVQEAVDYLLGRLEGI